MIGIYGKGDIRKSIPELSSTILYYKSSILTLINQTVTMNNLIIPISSSCVGTSDYILHVLVKSVSRAYFRLRIQRILVIIVWLTLRDLVKIILSDMIKVLYQNIVAFAFELQLEL